jgi:hypothetical protein
MHVFIIGNLSPGSKRCNKQWAQRYNMLIERYQDVVRLQAFGGEGIDTFHLQHPFAASNLETPFSYINVGGALGTYGPKNPSVRRYIMNADQNVPAYIHTLKYDLEAKNDDPTLNWNGE